MSIRNSVAIKNSTNKNCIKMKLNEFKSIVCFVIMVVFGIKAFITKDVLDSQLFAALGIIAGVLFSKIMSNQNTKTNEKY
jgi:hypothetical protein